MHSVKGCYCRGAGAPSFWTFLPMLKSSLQREDVGSSTYILEKKGNLVAKPAEDCQRGNGY